MGWWGFWSCLVVLGLTLGLWQWERAADKRDYLARLAAAPRIESPASAPPEGAQLALEGEYLAEETLFLDNRTHEGRLGVAPLTPFRDVQGRLWLVQRGFLPTGPSRAAPSVETPEGTVALEGRWQTAGEAAPLFGPNREGIRLQRIDLAAWNLASAFAHPGWLHLEQGPGHLESWWQPSVVPPERHLGYALQWWGLALAALVVMLVGGRRQARRLDPTSIPSKETPR
ncbi:SURF1 family protein [Halomonas ventosae]|uniref:SURF1-like protein n=1 Tax=Halomonas ventosae TaxID=229007 RepID=A0A2T0VM45_9GAMM|nr:SURF1 family protein [Halomonas ventosae]PRY71341.1 cytochrome oxidase assembly protein ShyY1 [Halomonas ventosae]